MRQVNDLQGVIPVAGSSYAVVEKETVLLRFEDFSGAAVGEVDPRQRQNLWLDLDLEGKSLFVEGEVKPFLIGQGIIGLPINQLRFALWFRQSEAVEILCLEKEVTVIGRFDKKGTPFASWWRMISRIAG